MAEIEMVGVASSNLAAVGYDEASETMRVEFRSGAAWDYEGVSRETYEGVLNAASPGKAFIANVRDAYSGRRVS